MKIVSIVSSELSLSFELVDTLSVLEIDFLDLIEPGDVYFYVRVGNAAATFLVNSHLDLGHGQIWHVHILGDVKVGLGDSYHANFLPITFKVNNTDLFRCRPHNETKLIYDLSYGSLIAFTVYHFDIVFEKVSWEQKETPLHRSYKAIEICRCALIVNDSYALQLLVVAINLDCLVVEVFSQRLDTDLHVVRSWHDCLVVLHPDVCNLARVGYIRLIQAHSFSIKKQDLAWLGTNGYRACIDCNFRDRVERVIIFQVCNLFDA